MNEEVWSIKTHLVSLSELRASINNTLTVSQIGSRNDIKKCGNVRKHGMTIKNLSNLFEMIQFSKLSHLEPLISLVISNRYEFLVSSLNVQNIG